MEVDLSKFNNSWYQPGSLIKKFFWYYINLIFFKTRILYPNSLKLFLLKAFGAKVGKKVLIKPSVNIKYPWFLEIGDNVWIGENVWIDNLGKVKIGSNVNISQGAMLLTGNHNYKRNTFDLIIGEIYIENGVWVGAKSIVCPGITMHSHSILSVGSVLTMDSNAYTIYQGNPAIAKKNREFE